MKSLKSLNRRYKAITWGTGFVWIGVLSLIPGNQNSIGLLGIGLILLGLNLARSFNKIPINWFTTVLGILASILSIVMLLLPVLDLPIFELDLFSLLLIVIGLYFLIPGPKHAKNSKANNDLDIGAPGHHPSGAAQ